MKGKEIKRNKSHLKKIRNRWVSIHLSINILDSCRDRSIRCTSHQDSDQQSSHRCTSHRGISLLDSVQNSGLTSRRGKSHLGTDNHFINHQCGDHQLSDHQEMSHQGINILRQGHQILRPNLGQESLSPIGRSQCTKKTMSKMITMKGDAGSLLLL